MRSQHRLIIILFHDLSSAVFLPGYMNFGPRIFRAGLSARKIFFLLQNRITLTVIFISHRAEIPGRNSVLPFYL
jgi:hypothetical protein